MGPGKASFDAVFRSMAADAADKSLKELNPTIDKLNKEIQTLQLAQPKQKIQDGYSDSSDGPFEITNRYGQTAITAVGDKIAVSPNMSFNNNPTSPTLDLTPFINAFTSFKNEVATIMSRPQPIPQLSVVLDRQILGKIVGSQAETGTAQNISTGYTMP
jgi:hypothetical protein